MSMKEDGSRHPLFMYIPFIHKNSPIRGRTIQKPELIHKNGPIRGRVATMAIVFYAVLVGICYICALNKEKPTHNKQ